MPPVDDARSEVSVPTSANALHLQRLEEEKLKLLRDNLVLGLGVLGITVGGALLGSLLGFIQDKIKERKAKKKDDPDVSSSDDEIDDDMLEEDALGEIVAGFGKRKEKRWNSYDDIMETKERMDILDDPEFREFLEEVMINYQ
jgi:hypothetical protein